MIKADLITGFLGSGKTTFIRGYASYLLRQNRNIAILENDYGAINVDMMMLKDLEGDHCDLEMVIGGNDYDTHKRRLKSKLITLGMLGYDRVLIEPSGIFDVDEFLDVLREDPLETWYEIGSIISIVDAKLSDSLSDESEYLLVSQTADAGAVVLSKTQDASDEDIRRTMEHLNRAFRKFHTDRILTESDPVLKKPWDSYTEEDFQTILHAGYQLRDHVKMPLGEDNAYQSLFFMNVDGLTPETLAARAGQLFADSSCGHVIRLKGYLSAGKNTEDPWIEINATKDKTEIRPARDGQAVIIVIGEHLDREKIGAYWNFQYGSGRELLP
ncbi:GTP-binding protein [Bilifractor porci]|uniref:GTPase (G3E family) n=1 Tax=Bilifractor porci TaxID=2606636 RepID=A0A7X2TN12_9FIRM|nr:GTP-binding protein [Bilifractor porci]MST81727.1 GTPase (G3E family) [Bilifractor porci]